MFISLVSSPTHKSRESDRKERCFQERAIAFCPRSQETERQSQGHLRLQHKSSQEGRRKRLQYAVGSGLSLQCSNPDTAHQSAYSFVSKITAKGFCQKD